MKEYYNAHGYSILAITDHELLVDHSDLNDEDFLTLTGYEYAFIEDKPYLDARTIELNLIAKEPHNETRIAGSGEVLTEAVFNIPDDEYMRFEVIDAYGRYAISRAYFLK